MSAERAERRQLTIMFCDLVGSTALAERLDPEDLRELVRAYQAEVSEIVGHFDGHVAQYLGDGILAYFGYPVAHEEDPRRAILAGLRIVEAFAAPGCATVDPSGRQLEVRVGLHTGPVVTGEVGGGGRSELLALGTAPNLAARVQGLAAPNSVVVTAATQRRARGYFDFAPLGAREIKGISQPVELFRVVGETDIHDTFALALRRGLTPAVGRQEELERVLALLPRVARGEGQVVLLQGEPGIGKSRLIHSITERLEGLAVWSCRCSPFAANSALRPVIELFHDLLGLRGQEDPATWLRKLEEEVRRRGLPAAETVPLLAQLLSIPLGDGFPSLDLTPQRQREKTLERILAYLGALAAERPLVLVFEDLHWVDPSTLELLDRLLPQVAGAPLLLLLSFRPTFTPPWSGSAHFTSIELARLVDDEVAEMVVALCGGKALPREVLDQVIAKTDGVPLFVEELCKMLLESGLLCEGAAAFELSGPCPDLAIPDTLQDSLAARLDRLSTARETAQLGAVLGREFSHEMLRAISTLSDSALAQALDQLVAAQLLYEQGTPPQASYLFKHALIQDAAYDSLLKSARRRYHQRIAEVIAERFPAIAAAQPELLAHHYNRAELAAPALRYWQVAGQLALERSATREAVHHLTQGLALLSELPEAERDVRELELQTALGWAHTLAEGWVSETAAAIYMRARELCDRIGDVTQLFSLIYGVGVFHFVRAEFDQVLELSAQLLEIARASGDPQELQASHFGFGAVYMLRGELATAREHLETAVALDPADRPVSPKIEDVGVCARCFASLTHWLLGDVGLAARRAGEAVALGRQLRQPYNLAYALAMEGFLHRLCRDRGALFRCCEEGAAIAAEAGFHLLPFCLFHLGWGAEALDGEAVPPEEGLGRMKAGLATWSGYGARVWHTFFLGGLAEVHLGRGEFGEARASLAEARRAVEQTHERFWLAEIHRLEGELSLVENALDEAEALFTEALAEARRQGARSLELRAVLSLGRLWSGQGKQPQARELVCGVCSGFTEGLATSDLTAARTFLASLAP